MSAGITDWLVPAVVSYFDQSWLVGVALLVGTTLVGASVEYVAVALCYRTLVQRLPAAIVPITTALAWTGAELCRTRIGFGNPWGLFGYAIVGDGTGAWWPSLVQVADLGGVYAVTFVLVTLNATIAEAAVAVAGRDARRAATVACLGAGVFVAAFAYGRARLAAFPEAGTGSVPIAVVQANLDLGSQWREEMYGQNLGAYLDRTERVLRTEQPAPRTVFWPENAMTFFVDHEPSYRAALAGVLGPHDVELVAGAPRFDTPDNPKYFNAAFVFRPDGEISGRYDKRRLMPFAEYFPLSKIDLLRRSFGRVRFFTPAPPLAPPPTRAGRLGVIICNEAIYPEDAADRVREGAEILVNLSNDSWVAGVEFAENQLRIATLRAIEQRRFLVRASTSGPSAIVAPSGRIVTRSEPFAAATLTGEVRPLTEVSTYARYGDLFAWMCLAVTVLALALARRARASDR